LIMKVSLTWLRDYVNITLPPAQLIERLTLAGLEVADVRILGLPTPEGVRVKTEERGPVWDRDKIVIAEVLGVERHPNADRLTLPTVTWGEGKVKQLVTGAPNIKPGDRGQKVVLALAGSVLYDGHSQEKVLKELKPAKVRGVPSDAMVCSFRELGISDEHEGIILLEADAPVGTPLADFMGDIVLEIDILPNMARCLSMIGIAREVAALTGEVLHLPPRPAAKQSSRLPEDQIKITIDDPKLCARYAAGLVRNVKIGPAPAWMQRRLSYAGMRPINNIVDITNFVMLEWGQPLHAFDYDVLVKRAGRTCPTIIVRAARPGETLTTLDGQKRSLSPDNLVIADSAGPIALAGVMGGAETEVTTQTTNILLESASFDFVSIRRTMKQFNLPSEASVRFSKGIHPETVRPAAERALDFMARCAGGTASGGLADCYPSTLPHQVVELKLPEVNRLLGVDFPKNEAVRILRALEFEVQDHGDVLQVTVPTHRLDIQVGSADLIEELARVYGYDRLPATLLAERLPRQQTNVAITFEERLRDSLGSCGLQEVITYALTMPARELPLTGPREYVCLKNPISSERAVMRQSVLAGVLEVAAANLRHESNVRLFEIGFVYVPKPGEKLPEEPRRLALLMTGSRRQEFWSDGAGVGASGKQLLDFFDLKGVVEELANDLHLADLRFQPSRAPHLLPGRSASLFAKDQPIGDCGQLHFKAAEAYGLGVLPILVGEFDVEALQALLPPRYQYTAVPRFPAALRDVAVVVAETVSAERVAGEIRAAGGELVRGIRLFDLYRGDSIPAGTKSLAYALTYQAGDRTLTDKEVDKAHKKIEDRLKHVLKAQIRGKD
jgi:phenylalanyl-tRNA synthetase beta chain